MKLWGTNTLVCLRSLDSLGMNKFVILRPFDSWGTNIFVLIPKKLFSFFMLWSRGIDFKEPIPLANVAWAHICKRLRTRGIYSMKPIPLANVAWACICKSLRSPGIDSKEPIPLANVAWACICKRLRSPGIDSASRAGTISRLGIDSGLLKRFTNTGLCGTITLFLLGS